MLFDKEIVNFGEVLPGSRKVVTFKYLGKQKIKRLIKSCSCTSADLNKDIITVVVDYRDKKRDYKKNVSVSVIFEDDTRQTLRIQAHVKVKN